MPILLAIGRFLTLLPAWFLAVFSIVFVSLFDLGRDVLAWLFEQALSIALSTVGQIDLDFSVFDPSRYWASIPADVINVLALLHLPQCVGIIVAAATVRFLLQLIPFVRLGS